MFLLLKLLTFFDKWKSMVEYYLFGQWVSCNNGLDWLRKTNRNKMILTLDWFRVWRIIIIITPFCQQFSFFVCNGSWRLRSLIRVKCFSISCLFGKVNFTCSGIRGVACHLLYGLWSGVNKSSSFLLLCCWAALKKNINCHVCCIFIVLNKVQYIDLFSLFGH